MNKCEDCKYSKTKTQVASNGSLLMDRFCFFHVPQVQLIPQQGGVGQISYRPKVEDDDFCSEFSRKPNTESADDIFGTKAKDASSNLIVDSGGRSRDISDGIQGRLP